MPERILHPEWRDRNEPTLYPFADTATLTNGQITLAPDVFLDAILYPIGAEQRMFLSRIEIDTQDATIVIGDEGSGSRASGSFDLLDPPDSIRLLDTFNRPAGLLVSTAKKLTSFQTIPVGTHQFQLDQTTFAATVSVPTPEIGVRGILLEDGTLFTGDVWMIGEDGVVLRREVVTSDGSPCGGPTRRFEVIRVDIVGDPLFRRRLCDPVGLFVTPRFIEKIRARDSTGQSFICEPDEFGDFKITVGNNLAEDTILRVRTTPQGIIIEAVGQTVEDL